MVKLKRSAWLLLLLYDPESEIPHSLDPIRIQKAMFYFAQQASVPDSEKYEFVPYHYGPCSFAIYRDIDALVAAGLVGPVPVIGQAWSKYRLTEAGIERAKNLSTNADAQPMKVCSSARERVLRHSFRSLLREVYEQYPQFATKSVLDKLP